MKRPLIHICFLFIFSQQVVAQQVDDVSARAIFLQIERIKTYPPAEKIEATIRLAQQVKTPSRDLTSLLDQSIGDASQLGRIDLYALLYALKGKLLALDGDAGASVRILKKAQEYCGKLNRDSALQVKSVLAESYLVMHHYRESRLYFDQVYSELNKNSNPIESRVLHYTTLSNAYTQLNDVEKLSAIFRDLERLAETKEHRVMINKAVLIHADNLSKVNNPIEGTTLYKNLVKEPALSEHDRIHILCMLVINLCKLQQVGELDFYYQRLQTAVQASKAPNDEEVQLAGAMYLEAKGKLLQSRLSYLSLLQHASHSAIMFEGAIRLAALYSAAFKKDSANKYFALIQGAPVVRSNKALQYDLARALDQHQRRFSNEASLLKQMSTALKVQDSIYEHELVNATRELNLRYHLLESEQQVRQATYHQQLTIIRNKQLQQRALLLVVSLLFSCIAAAVLVFYFYYRKKQQSRLYGAELSRMELEHRTTVVSALAEAQEAERNRIAEQLHDEVGSMLSVARLNLSALEEKSFGSEVDEKLATTATVLATVAQTIREMSHHLMPIGLKQYGLKKAVQQLVADINHSKALAVEHVIVGFDEKRYPDEFYVNCFRIIQELLQNILKHAAATQALLQVVECDDVISILAEDNGKGFPASGSSSGMGLQLLRSRIAYLNGQLSIENKKEGGAMVTIELPVHSTRLISTENEVPC